MFLWCQRLLELLSGHLLIFWAGTLSLSLSMSLYLSKQDHREFFGPCWFDPLFRLAHLWPLTSAVTCSQPRATAFHLDSTHIHVLFSLCQADTLPTSEWSMSKPGSRQQILIQHFVWYPVIPITTWSDVGSAQITAGINVTFISLHHNSKQPSWKNCSLRPTSCNSKTSIKGISDSDDISHSMKRMTESVNKLLAKCHIRWQYI